MSYKEDWEQALADGSGMERIPSGWISVREIEYECGVKYEFLVGLGNRQKMWNGLRFQLQSPYFPR